MKVSVKACYVPSPMSSVQRDTVLCPLKVYNLVEETTCVHMKLLGNTKHCVIIPSQGLMEFREKRVQPEID